MIEEKMLQVSQVLMEIGWGAFAKTQRFAEICATMPLHDM